MRTRIRKWKNKVQSANNKKIINQSPMHFCARSIKQILLASYSGCSTHYYYHSPTIHHMSCLRGNLQHNPFINNYILKFTSYWITTNKNVKVKNVTYSYFSGVYPVRTKITYKKENYKGKKNKILKKKNTVTTTVLSSL